MLINKFKPSILEHFVSLFNGFISRIEMFSIFDKPISLILGGQVKMPA